MESLLVEWFNHAQRWSAVILLDEADVFFEHREVGVTKRNALVSGKSFTIIYD